LLGKATKGIRPRRRPAGPNERERVSLKQVREVVKTNFSHDHQTQSHQIESFFKRSHKAIVALTVQEILDEHIAKNWFE
jgi:hypothetical protein